MSKSILDQAHFHSEEAAYSFVEARIWPKGAVCPHCGGVERNKLMGGKSTRIGLYKCYDCRKPFTVKIGTIFEASHIPLRLWLQAIFLIASSKKGVSSNQLHRTLGITLKSAWFMSHRVREAMKDGRLGTFGSNGGIVEADETFIGIDSNKERKGTGYGHKQKVFALIDRTSGQSRSIVVDDIKGKTLLPIMRANVDTEAYVMTDEAKHYKQVRTYFAKHRTVQHGIGEYVNALDNSIHTNTIEGFFSVFKRGMKGVYQHCGHNHLNRYLAEFDFRYSNRVKLGVNDEQRADKLLVGAKGKRLTYKTVGQ
jgi:transposase-like protein